MANNKSAEKRIRTNERNRLQNRFYKSSVRTLTKKFLQDLAIYKESQNPEQKEKLTKMLGSVYSLIDKGTKKMFFIKIRLLEKKLN
jgi:small subunit ribosomal protein S20